VQAISDFEDPLIKRMIGLPVAASIYLSVGTYCHQYKQQGKYFTLFIHFNDQMGYCWF
jgi:hypothetical protein